MKKVAEWLCGWLETNSWGFNSSLSRTGVLNLYKGGFFKGVVRRGAAVKSFHVSGCVAHFQYFTLGGESLSDDK